MLVEAIDQEGIELHPEILKFDDTEGLAAGSFSLKFLCASCR